MKYSSGIAAIVAVMWGAQTNRVAAQATEEAPPSPPDASTAALEGPSTAVSRTAVPSTAEGAALPPPTPTDSSRTAKNVLYVELLGNGILYSLNYERFITDDLSARIGFGYLSLGASSSSSSARASVLWLPLMVNYLGVGSADHKLQLGLGPVLFYASSAASSVGDSAKASGVALFGTATIGYRYVPHDGGFNFDIGFTPVFGSFGFLPWIGISLGAVF
jgi:hypothetical protein